MEFDAQQCAARLEALARTERPEQVVAAVAGLHPADLAAVLHVLDRDLRERLFQALDDAAQADILPELDESTRSALVGELSTENIAEVAEAMEPDEAADLLGDLPEKQTAEVLEQMEDAASEEVKGLLEFDEDTAGGIMTPELVAVDQNMTAAETVVHLRSLGERAFSFYVYVVDHQHRLLGLVRLRKLVTVPPTTMLKDIMDTDVHSVRAEADQEEIASMFRRYGLPAMPVVDKDGTLLGRITVDDVLEVAEEEATEDAYKLAGTTDQELASTSVVRIAGVRLPWLLICLCGTVVSALVMSTFRQTISSLPVIAFFIPAIMAMGGNSGLQATTVTVRGLATGHINPSRILEVVIREVSTALLLGVVCGLLLGLVVRFWQGHPMLGLVVGFSMFFGISTAATLGALVPIILKRLNVDPAVASGPFITTMNDVLGLLIYLGLATGLMSHLKGG